MKFLGKLFTVVGVAMLGVVGALAQTEDTVANAVIDLSRQSEQLQLAVSELNSTTLPSQGQNVVTDLHNLSASIAMYTQTINGSDVVFPDYVALEITDLLTGFVDVQHYLLKTIVQKHPLAKQFSFTNPVDAALATLESFVDEFAAAIIALIPTRESDARVLFTRLTADYKEAIATYSS